MRVLVAWGSKMGGTEGIARIIGEELTAAGVEEVVLAPASEAQVPNGYSAAIIGGALYANRWEKSARRLVERHIAGFRQMPVWLFSSGPLDHSATETQIPPTRHVATLMDRVGALGHATFGGRMPKDAKGFPAAAMAKDHSGDWRDPQRIRRWAAEIAAALPTARSGEVKDPPGASVVRLAGFAASVWAVTAVIEQILVHSTPYWAAATVNAALTIVIAAALARSYFRPRGAWSPALTAAIFTLTCAVLDAVVLGAVAGNGMGMFTDIAMTWLPYALVFAVTLATGVLTEMIPAHASR